MLEIDGDAEDAVLADAEDGVAGEGGSGGEVASAEERDEQWGPLEVGPSGQRRRRRRGFTSRSSKLK